MRLLLINDDGIEAQGLAALERAMAHFGETIVVAPDRPLSNCGHQVTTDRPIPFQCRSSRRYALGGSPADCARLGLLHLAPDADWVVSGINAGGNLGVDVYMSGTVAAVREAALLGKPAVAFSQYRLRACEFDWLRAQRWAVEVFQRLLQEPLGKGLFWNVNFPAEPNASLPPIVTCPPDPNPLAIAFEQQESAFVYRGVYQQRPRQAGSDVNVCFQGHIAASKLSCGLLSSP